MKYFVYKVAGAFHIAPINVGVVPDHVQFVPVDRCSPFRNEDIEQLREAIGSLAPLLGLELPETQRRADTQRT